MELVNRAGGSIGEKMAHLTVPALGVVGSYVIIVDFDDDLFDSDYTAFAFKKCAERRTNASSKAKTGREHRKVQREEKKKGQRSQAAGA